MSGRGPPGLAPLDGCVLGHGVYSGGRVIDAVPLLTQALEQTIVAEMVVFQARCSLSLGEAHLLAGHLEEAHALAEQALALAERGHRRMRCASWATLQPIAIPQNACRRNLIASTPSPWLRSWACARSLPTADGAWAQCMPTIGRRPQARIEVSTAIALYRTMDMTFWLRQAEEALAQLEEGG